ncbi:MAG: hypothetical protein ACTSRS_20855 [Candidatus Helarchaeota archaeon]
MSKLNSFKSLANTYSMNGFDSGADNVIVTWITSPGLTCVML